MADHTFYLEVSKGAGMAKDEHNNPSEAYLKISYDTGLNDSFSDEQIVSFASSVSTIGKEHLRSISKEEYILHMEED